MQWEIEFLRWLIENLHNPLFDWFMHGLTFLGEVAWIYFLVSFVFLFFKKTRKTGIACIAALILIAGFNLFVFKYIFKRIRPFREDNFLYDYVIARFKNNNMFNTYPSETSYSFMSGHTLSAFLFATIVSIYHKRTLIPNMIIASLMSFTRLYYPFHYPTDVIAGVLTGVAFGTLTVLVANKLEIKINKTIISRKNRKLESIEK
jgi:undecaprenyl-diphosphatase